MKRYLILPLLALLMVVGASAHDFEVDGIFYAINPSDPSDDSGEYQLFTDPTVSVTNESVTYGSYSGDVEIPASVTYQGVRYIVTGIADQAFCQSTSLTSVSIPWTVSTIGAKAFAYCTGLQTVTMFNLKPFYMNVAEDSFYNVNVGNVLVRATYEAREQYSQHPFWLTFKDIEYLMYNFTQKDVNGNTIYYLIRYDECSLAVASDTDDYESPEKYFTYYDDVVIPAYVTYQGITLPVREIDNYAFYNCTGLKSVKLPNTLTFFDWHAFENCINLKEIYLPASIDAVGVRAFQSCTSLTSVTFGKGLKRLQWRAFYDCTSLESVTFLNPDETTLYNECLSNLPLKSLTVYSSTPSNFTLEEKVFLNDDLSSAHLYVPQGATSAYRNGGTPWSDFGNISEMGATVDYDFAEANAGRDIYYSINPDGTSVSVTFKSKTAASYVGNIVIPSTVTHDGTTYDVTAIAPYAFYYKNTSLKSVTIPNSVTTIGERAFSGTSINSVSIGSGVTSIGDKAFLGCNFLTELTLPEGLKEIGTGAFTSCSRLKSLVIPNSVIIIGDEAFWGANSLEELTIGEEVRYIGSNAFGDLVALKTINAVAATPDYMDMDTGVFEGCDVETVTLNVPKGGKAGYKRAPQWCDFLNIHEEGEAILGDVIGDGKLNSVDITYIVQHLLGNTPYDFNSTAADANEDGKINSADITAIIVKILGLQ